MLKNPTQMPSVQEVRGPATPDPLTDGLTTLLFMIFVFVTDSDHDITPQEVRTLHGLAADPHWAASRDVQRALPLLRESYTAFWGRYETGALPIGEEAITARIQAICGALPVADAKPMLAALSQFVDRIERVSAPMLPWSTPANTARTRARATARRLLSEPRLPDPAAPPTLAPTAMPALVPGPVPAGATTRMAAPPAWSGKRTRLRCLSVRRETADVKTFRFTACTPCLFLFEPGQFVTLEVPLDGRVVRRSYTISSSPASPFTLSVTIKCGPDGVVSRWMHENMREAVEIDVLGPAGDFSCLRHPADRLLLISGGSGVTPVMSMLRYLADTAPDTDIAFLNSVRSPADIIFERELMRLSAELGPSLRLGIIPALVGEGQAWNGMTGRINAGLLTAMVPDFAEREAFVCGPQPFMEAMREVLRGLGYPMHRFHQESFGPAGQKPAAAASVPAPPALPTTPPPRPGPVRVPEPPPAPPQALAETPDATILFGRSGAVARGSGRDCILDIAEANGIQMDCSCRSGACGTCRVRVSSGHATMDDPGALSPEDIQQGYVLACIARPVGRVTLDA